MNEKCIDQNLGETLLKIISHSNVAISSWVNENINFNISVNINKL